MAQQQPAGDRTRPTFPLPAELITHIVELSSPMARWATFPMRSAHLRSLAVVSRAFRGPAQAELFRHLVLPSATAARLLVAVLESSRLASTVRSLRAGCVTWSMGTVAVSQDEFALPFLMRTCHRLEDIWAVELELQVADVLWGTALKRLFCYRCRFTAPPAQGTPKASALEWLGIAMGGGPGDFRIITTGGLPLLGALSITEVPSSNVRVAQAPGVFSRRASREAFDYRSSIKPIGSQLISLSIDESSTAELDASSFPRLTTLNLIHGLRRDPIPFLSALPSPIRHLRAQTALEKASTARGDADASVFVLAHLKEHQYGCFEDLLTLRLPNGCAESRAVADVVRSARPAVTLSFDETLQYGDAQELDADGKALDAMFGPTFWAFVADAERARARGVQRG